MTPSPMTTRVLVLLICASLLTGCGGLFEPFPEALAHLRGVVFGVEQVVSPHVAVEFQGEVGRDWL